MDTGAQPHGCVMITNTHLLSTQNTTKTYVRPMKGPTVMRRRDIILTEKRPGENKGLAKIMPIILQNNNRCSDPV